MGNTADKNAHAPDTDHASVTLQLDVNDLELRRPTNVPRKISGRIDPRIWSEFNDLCYDAVALHDIKQRRKKSKRFVWRHVIGLVSLLLSAAFLFTVVGLYAHKDGWTLITIFIVLTALMCIMFCWLSLCSAPGENALQTEFVRDVTNRVVLRMKRLNRKYSSELMFMVRDPNNVHLQLMQRRKDRKEVLVHVDVYMLAQIAPYKEDALIVETDGGTQCTPLSPPQFMHASPPYTAHPNHRNIQEQQVLIGPVAYGET